MTMSTTASWQISPASGEMPSWITISPMSGNAGDNQVVTFTATEASENRNVNFNIVADGKTQIIMFKQSSSDNKLVISTVSDVNAGADGKTYYVRGIVTGISNTVYGNWYLKDDTGSLLIYGTLDKNGGKQNFSSLGLAEGDEVLISGPKTTYGTTVELVNVTVHSITKSLLATDAAAYKTEGNEAAEVEITVTCVDGGVSVQSGSDWASIKGIKASGNDKYVVTVACSANETYSPRKATITLTHSSSDVTPVSVTITQAGIEPTTVTIAEAAAMASGTYVTIEGIVVAVGYSSYIIADETGCMHIYKGAYSVKTGYKMKIVGAMSAYNRGPQIQAPAVEERLSKETATYGSPLVLDGAKADEMLGVSAVTIQYVQVTGTLSISSNKYFNLTIEGAETAIGSVYSVTDAQKTTLSAFDGKTVTIKGYLVSISSSKYLNIVMTSAE